MPGDPTECRENAACCREMAARAPSAAARETFHNLADSWERLALQLENAQVLVKSMGAKEANRPFEPSTAAALKFAGP
jgi:hypothetical protein